MPPKLIAKQNRFMIPGGWAVLLLAGWLAYAHTLDVPFYFDDYPNIIEVPAVHLTQFSIENLKEAITKIPLHNRPLAYLSFALNFYSGGFNVIGYHLVNIAFHLGAGAMLYWLVQVTLSMDRPDERSRRGIALLVTLVWLLHPVQTQAVTYIVQRMTIMASFFYLAALCLYVAGRRAESQRKRWCRWLGCLVAGSCALASKEIALTLPAAIWLYEWIFFQGGQWLWLRRSLIPSAIALFILMLVILLYSRFDLLTTILSSYGGRDFSISQRLLTQPRVILFYITLIFWPHPNRLSLHHPIDVSTDWVNPPETLGAFMILIILIMVAFLVIRKDRCIAFAIFWFFGNMVVESSVIGLEMIYEHRLYLPTMFSGLLIYRLLNLSRGRWGFRHVLLVMSPCCLILGFWTVDRNELWRNPVAFWSHTVDKAPHSSRVRSNLAVELMRVHDIPAAVIQLEKALALDHNNLSALLNLAEAKDWLEEDDEALRIYEKALHLTGDAPKVLQKFAMFHIRRGRYEEAERLLQKGLEDKPRLAGLLFQLGRVYLAQQNLEKARMMLEQAIKSDPGLAEAYDYLGQVLFAQRQTGEAITAFRKAVYLRPSNADFYFNLAYAFELSGADQQAVLYYQKVLKLRPNDEVARYRFTRLSFRYDE